MGIFYGGIAQIFVVVCWSTKKATLFGLTAFTSYGSFWLTLVAILLMQTGSDRFAKSQFLHVCLDCGHI
ncbi:acetate uptake transporter [Escherichia coli]